MGVSVIVLYMSNYSNKVDEKLSHLERQEKKQLNNTRESLTSTVSHEMRTPIGSMMFFVSEIIDCLERVPNPTQDILEAIKFCKLVMSLLNFLMSFVDDLIDLRQIHDGGFLLEQRPFLVQKVLKVIFDIFEP